MIAIFLFVATSAAAWAAVDSVETEVHFQNGIKYMKRGLYEKSIREFEKTLALDASYEEARAYLEQVKELYRQASPVDAKASEDTAMRALYREGRSFYRKGAYESAIEVFTKILEKKPIDDYASYYRERSEIMISRRQAKERRVADKERKLQEKARQKELNQQAKAQKKMEREEKLQKRAMIQEERRQARQVARQGQRKPGIKEEEKADKAARVMAAVDTDKPLTPREEKILAKKQRRAEAERRAEERRWEKLQAKENRIQARDGARARAEQKVEARQESKKAQQDKVREKKAAERMDRELSAEQRRQNKEIFISGVEAYGRKDYETALTTLSQLIEAEKESGLVYTSTAKRMIEKAQKRLAGEGQDVAV